MALIDYPGDEIKSATVQTITAGVMTPFAVEFARSSLSRDHAPTLIPVEVGGAAVPATIFVLREEVSEKLASDMLWRRETGRVHSGRAYSPQPGLGNRDAVQVERLEN